MPLKKGSGNMYPGVWTKSYLGGECSHACSYCYVRAMTQRFPSMATRHSGSLRLCESEFTEDLGNGCLTVFVEHLNDLFAEDVPQSYIRRVLEHLSRYRNTYWLQTKNPARFWEFWSWLPPGCVLGTTIETNRHFPAIMQRAPAPHRRVAAMLGMPHRSGTYVTLEPLLDFDLDILSTWLVGLSPSWVWVGADSKGHGLPEPTGDKVHELVRQLRAAGLDVREKPNLLRLLGGRRVRP